MNKEQMRIKIAEACGWKDIQINFDSKSGLIGKKQSIPSYCHSIPYQGYNFEGSHRSDYGAGIPDYLNDLNAMHEAEKVLTSDLRIDYLEEVSTFTGSYGTSLYATAAQRAEAFLRTLSLWTE